MSNTLPVQLPSCSQCGGELHPDEGQIFLTCPYCAATVFLDRSRVVFHWYLASTLDQEKAQGALRRWMAGNQTVKDLDRKATIHSSSFEYFPVWYFKLQPEGGKEEIRLRPAAATSVTEIEQIDLPAGDLRKYESSLDAQAHMPSVPLETAIEWLAQGQAKPAPILEQSLVHIPLYTFKYSFQGNHFTAVVEAGTGEVFANIFPAKAEMPYRTIGLITALVFLCLAVIPLVLSIGSGAEGTGLGLLICFGLGIVFIPILFGIAVFIAARV